MKYIFLIVAVLLSLFSFATYMRFPDAKSEVPVLFWVTDPNPARTLQVETFKKWLIKHGHVTADGKPAVDLRIDAANGRMAKKIIQTVSGVGGDVMDLFNGRYVRYMDDIGVLEELTDSAKEMGFDLSKTYKALETELVVNGRQMAFPCNVVCSLLLVNKDVFEKYGQPLPPEKWTIDEFERLGKAYVKAANEPGKQQTNFYAIGVDYTLMHRSMGLSIFNETLTASTLDDERYVKTLDRISKWIHEDHIIPTEAEIRSFNVGSGYGGLTAQLFYRGNFAMIYTGRYMLIQLRRFEEPMKLGAVSVPFDHYPNARISTRTSAMYKGGNHKEAAKLFYQYLASEDYNMLIVNDADALPPNPEYAKGEAFLRPEKFPNEWGIHEKFVNQAKTIAIGGVYSPFVADAEVFRSTQYYYDRVVNKISSPEEAASATKLAIDKKIALTLREKPALQEMYDKLTEDQKVIDQCKTEGKKIPLRLVRNPFLKRYYKDMSMGE
ncbi:Bacterial extracellular solute-binding protein [Poriferisphaera corsica]|uniref:Bacterial extracellular solute-binding protein n=1 Tax=Poriferisphaera corsica TaxID=2528020 RepID=A0A517YRY2_9BACT|nr:ABC transporter substrate-binding protein [Poriferisphaera corsica]QDU32979.1 Bacterial extracellular solute-binding protein [Poriferisphaera corsica]